MPRVTLYSHIGTDHAATSRLAANSACTDLVYDRFLGKCRRHGWRWWHAWVQSPSNLWDGSCIGKGFALGGVGPIHGGVVCSWYSFQEWVVMNTVLHSSNSRVRDNALTCNNKEAK